MKNALIVSIIILTLAGCASTSTYPPSPGFADSVDASVEPIPTLMAEAIRYAQIHYGQVGEDIAINLPPGTPSSVYNAVAQQLGNGHPQFDSAEPAYHIVEVRLKTMAADVDIYYPRKGLYHEFVTMSFTQNLIGKYKVKHTRLWRLTKNPPEPNYREAAMEAVSAPTGSGDEP